MLKTLMIAAAIGAITVIGASAAPLQEGSTPAKTTVSVPTEGATNFAKSLADAVAAVVAKNAGATPAELTGLVQAAIQEVFVQGNVSPAIARAAMPIARGTLTGKGLICAPPAGDATKSCEAVGKAFAVAVAAADAADPATAATGGGGVSPLAAPPGTGAGGGGGGVTHPPVAPTT